jgi:phosphatidylglycerophosphatase A
MTRLAFLLATWFGCGRSRFAPGTVGSAAALAIAIALHYYAGFTGWHFPALAAVLFFPAVWSAGVVARVSKIEDPGFVVVDEVLGQWIALGAAQPFNWITCLAAFALFRTFDIWKPFPVRRLEALPGGWGINADDALAGIYAALVILLARWFNLFS